MSDDILLKAVSPLDGRYRPKVKSLAWFFSEAALIKCRLKVEILYLLFLSQKGIIKKLNPGQTRKLLLIINNFDEIQALRVKEIEKKTNHDVKAIEYFLREIITPLNLGIEEYLHFALTSEDTNSLAYSLSLKEARDLVILPLLGKLNLKIAEMAWTYKSKPMLGRTHGQPAVPTTMGKELLVFAVRIDKERRNLASLPVEAKLTGAVGNFNAHYAAFPRINWQKFSENFVSSLGFVPNLFTTQILPADSYLKIFQSLSLINSILIGFDQDLWRYISDGYFRQKVEKGQVGSSTMPQKINPIDFENSEGNLGVANALLNFLVEKLAISRLQRDLSDSTVKRNIGVAFAYSLLGYQSCFDGLGKISLDEEQLERDLKDHWEVVTEGIQTILRVAGGVQAYEKLKDFSQGRKLGQKEIEEFVKSLTIKEDLKRKILSITPLTYLGLAEELVEEGLKFINFPKGEDK